MTQENPPDVDVATSITDIIDNHPLLELLGDSARVRILAVLYGAPESLNPERIVEHAGISRATFYNHVDELLATGLMVKTGSAGNSPLYALDKDDPRFDALDVLASETVNQHLTDEQ